MTRVYFWGCYIVLINLFRNGYLMCMVILGLPSFRFETLKDSLQVTKNHLFIRYLGISTKKIMFYGKIPNFEDLRN